MASFLLNSYFNITSFFGFSTPQKSDEPQTENSKFFHVINYNQENCCSISIKFNTIYYFKLLRNIIYAYYDKKNFEDKGGNGFLYSLTYKNMKVVLHLHETTQLIHIQGAGCFIWFQEKFPDIATIFYDILQVDYDFSQSSIFENDSSSNSTSASDLMTIDETQDVCSHGPLNTPVPVTTSTPIKYADHSSIFNKSDRDCLLNRIKELEQQLLNLQQAIKKSTRTVESQTDGIPEPIETPVSSVIKPQIHQPENSSKCNPSENKPYIPKKTLIVGSSILQRIRMRGLSGNVEVHTHRGATLPTILHRIVGLNIPDFDKIIIQAGGNDISQGQTTEHIKQDYTKIFQHIKYCSPSTDVYFSEITPRRDVEVLPINHLLEQLSKELGATFIRHSTDLILESSSFWKDGIHLSDRGTSRLLQSYDKHLPIVKPKENVYTKRSDHCFYCQQRGHNTNTCRNGDYVTCRTCGVAGHKAKSCIYSNLY
ncbi:hypothetical protein SNE40_016800 [Patella caerulea]|uniref:CCHC-type domain-containing protein n=1 Tax=Patella caerulea TaxID=87958 RepID=A0AAN8JDS3_PATCE